MCGADRPLGPPSISEGTAAVRYERSCVERRAAAADQRRPSWPRLTVALTTCGEVPAGHEWRAG